MEWNDETRATLRHLWAEGVSTAEMGRRMGITKNAVVGKAHRMNLPARPTAIRPMPNFPQEALDEIPRMMGQGMTHKEIGARFGLTERQVAHFCRQHGISANADYRRTQQFRHASIAHIVRKKRPSPPRIVAKKPPPQQPAAVVNLPSLLRVSSSATLGGCCWPLGAPRSPGFRFCGEPAMPKRPYCEEHVRTAYVRVREAA